MPLRRLAIVCSTALPSDLDSAVELAIAAAATCEVSMFFMSNAVGALAARLDLLERLEDEGIDRMACGTSAHELGLGESELRMLIGSQDDHAAMVSGADRCVAFT